MRGAINSLRLIFIVKIWLFAWWYYVWGLLTKIFGRQAMGLLMVGEPSTVGKGAITK